MAIKWFPLIMTNLIKVQCNFSSNTTLPAFQTMLYIIDLNVSARLRPEDTKTKRIEVLVSYLHHYFDIRTLKCAIALLPHSLTHQSLIIWRA